MGRKRRTRKEQIEKDFLERLIHQLQVEGCTIYKSAIPKLKAALKSAAMVGACEERDRTLAIIRANAHGCSFNRDVSSEIIGKGVLEVLGYGSSEPTAACTLEKKIGGG